MKPTRPTVGHHFSVFKDSWDKQKLRKSGIQASTQRNDWFYMKICWNWCCTTGSTKPKQDAEIGATDKSIKIVFKAFKGASEADWCKEGRVLHPEVEILCVETFFLIPCRYYRDIWSSEEKKEMNLLWREDDCLLCSFMPRVRIETNESSIHHRKQSIPGEFFLFNT